MRWPTEGRPLASRTTRILLAAATIATGTDALAATGLAALPATATQGPVTLLYPTEAAPAALQRGPFTLQAAVDAAPARGNGRLVVLSHGSGGSVWPQFDLASALVAAGFTVAMPLHQGDNFEDTSDVGPVSWARRPQEVSRAIDAVAALAAPGGRLAPLQLDLQRVGAYGMSAGGLTALALAGGRWSPALLAQHCDAHIAQDFAACVGLSTELTGGVLDSAKIGIAQRVIRAKLGSDTAWRSWSEPRIAAVVSAVPMAAPFDMASLATPRVPLGLVRAGQDAWLAPRWHSDAVRAACAERCTLLADMAQGGHGSILSPVVPGLSGALGRLLNDPPGFDRSTLAQVYDAITAFFVKNLGTAPTRTP
ncbi:dienelactone hydrolase [Pseudorhodoferax sp. Leaf265]|jgi:predicted dienelactone hydrolase|uniref:alpha/beta hydrolase family protein n=1 Tax=Pseudorhodoferax sp. Leaf265 TaxID=1736315 RepID=UPI001F2119E1|nr:dienelactone hydrolase [Pseudorhodoferax sp. Leaf265]